MGDDGVEWKNPQRQYKLHQLGNLSDEKATSGVTREMG